MNKFSYILIGIFILWSCVSDYDIDLSDETPIPVLNGVLCPDSTLSFSLHWSNIETEATFIPIEDAEIIIIKNNDTLNVNSHYCNGEYTYEDTVKENDKYEISIYKSTFQKALYAETTVPSQCDFIIQRNTSMDDKGTLRFWELIGNSTGVVNDTLYIFPQTRNNDSSEWMIPFIYCNSTYIDDFNSGYDATSAPKGFLYDYSICLRLMFDNIEVEDTRCDISFYSEKQVRMTIIHPSAEYDAYYKAILTQQNQDITTDILTYEPIFLPSNVRNGAGIFASITQSTFDFRYE